MTVHDVIKHFGGVRPAGEAIGVSYQAVDQWLKKGEVPIGRQFQYQVLTQGVLKASPEYNVKGV